MNVLDWMIIVMIVLSAIIAYYKGFLRTMFQFLSTIISIYLSYKWYQPINTILRQTFLYSWLQKLAVKNVVGLQGVMGLSEQTQLLNSLTLPIPHGTKENLIKHNNPEIYKMLGINNFTDYVGGYIANFYLSIIAFVILLCVIKFVLYLIGKSIHIISKLPIIRFADRWLGLGIGVIRGVISVWLGVTVVAFVMILPQFNSLSTLLAQSTIAKWFYENNLILEVIDQIFI